MDPVLENLTAAVRERSVALAAMGTADGRIAERLVLAVALGLDSGGIVAAIEEIEPAAPCRCWPATPVRLDPRWLEEAWPAGAIADAAARAVCG